MRPIAAADSVWIEELTYFEVRDALKAGKTTALILAGSTEQNGPYLAEASTRSCFARPARRSRESSETRSSRRSCHSKPAILTTSTIEWGSMYFTIDTFKAVVRDMTTSLKSQGFRNIILMGDSGGDTAGLKAVAQELTAKWNGTPGVYHIPRSLQLEFTGCSGR